MRKVINIGLAAFMLLFSACGKEKEPKSVKIGEQIWMSENLNDRSKGGKCYGDERKNCKEYGRLYSWEEAMKACPDGWRLPNNAEWEILVEFAGGANVAGGKLKAKSGWDSDGDGTDEYGFSALPGGFCNGALGSFMVGGSSGFWWSSTEDNAGKAYDWAIGYGYSNVSKSSSAKFEFLSVRCIKGIDTVKSPKADSMAAFATTWPRMGVDKFGCMMEKNFGHKDERFNCSLSGYENKGDPCDNTAEYYEGFAFPEHLVKKVHPQLSSISLSWEHGDLQMIIFYFDGDITKKQILNTFGLSEGSYTNNIMSVTADDNSLMLIGFDHMGAGDVDCEDETEESEKVKSFKIGEQIWMSQNINDPSKGGKCYEDKPENCEKYGRLYTWEEAMKACPEGWHLPSDEEWEALFAFAGGLNAAGGKLKAINGWEKGVSENTNEYGFSALPGGYGSSDGSFEHVGDRGLWWSSNEGNADNTANLWYMTFNSRKVYENIYETSSLLSVRCIKD